MTRKSFRFWLVALLLGPACALALEIGEIQVSSALNQLFDAKIPLPALAPEELDRVSVRLAPPPMFKEFGLERTPTLANLVFSIEYNAEGQVYVRVISTQPIREPSLGLLLEFNWPRGKTFREFTVFLDPVQRLAKRPGDRTKTVLNTPERTPPEPASVPAPAAVVATPAIIEPSAGSPLPVEISSAVEPVSEQARGGVGSPLPVETSSAPVKTYKPGDSYGPVAPGEGLWGIALKVRPDPAISHDQMMQALFKANPQAFSKAGIGGLKIGSVLRIPTLLEIANFTGSSVARRLAETGQPSTASEVAGSARTGTAPAPASTESARMAASGSEAFPLTPPVVPEPTVVIMPPTTSPDAVEPKPEDKPGLKPVVAAAPEPEAPKPAATVSEPEVSPPVVPKPAVATLPELEMPKPAAVAAVPEPEVSPPVVSEPTVATSPESETPKPAAVAAILEPEVSPPVAPEPAVMVPAAPGPEASRPAEMKAAQEPEIPPPAGQTVDVATELSPQILEPVSVTPLLFLAVSEVMATAAHIPVMTMSVQVTSTPPVMTDVEVPEPVGEAAAIKEAVPAVIMPPTTVVPEPAPVLTDVASLLAEVERLVPQAVLDLPPQSLPASDIAVSPKPAAESAEAISTKTVARPGTDSSVEPESPRMETAESAGPPATEFRQPPVEAPVAESSELPLAAPVTESSEPPAGPPTPESQKMLAEPSLVESAKPVVDYKGGDQYGPVSANERLWDIAGKVRPDPGIGKDVMMRALFMANPQSFSKPNMNSLKTGAILRVPTLREIVDYTGSKVAKQLLEQQQSAESKPVEAAVESDRMPSAPPASAVPEGTVDTVPSSIPATPPDNTVPESATTPAATVRDETVTAPATAPPVVNSGSVPGPETLLGPAAPVVETSVINELFPFQIFKLTPLELIPPPTGEIPPTGAASPAN